MIEKTGYGSCTIACFLCGVLIPLLTGLLRTLASFAMTFGEEGQS